MSVESLYANTTIHETRGQQLIHDRQLYTKRLDFNLFSRIKGIIFIFYAIRASTDESIVFYELSPYQQCFQLSCGYNVYTADMNSNQKRQDMTDTGAYTPNWTGSDEVKTCLRPSISLPSMTVTWANSGLSGSHKETARLFWPQATYWPRKEKFGDPQPGREQPDILFSNNSAIYLVQTAKPAHDSHENNGCKRHLFLLVKNTTLGILLKLVRALMMNGENVELMEATAEPNQIHSL